MQSNLALILIAVGAVLLLLSLGADVIGIGRHPEFGLRQWAGTIMGIILLVVGWTQRRRS